MSLRDDQYGKPLTPSESEVLERVAEGLSQKQVAEERHCSEKTVKNQLWLARWKLGAQNTLHAVVLAARSGQVDIRVSG
jgi:DNA-binding NarL/FixJ family response regulator